MRDIENFSGGIRDEIVLAGPGCVPVCIRDVECFEIEGGMRDYIVKTGKKTPPELTRSLLID